MSCQQSMWRLVRRISPMRYGGGSRCEPLFAVQGSQNGGLGFFRSAQTMRSVIRRGPQRFDEAACIFYRMFWHSQQLSRKSFSSSASPHRQRLLLLRLPLLLLQRPPSDILMQTCQPAHQISTHFIDSRSSDLRKLYQIAMDSGRNPTT